MEGLNKIYDLTADGGFVKVLLKDGRTIECQADCFGETELELDGETVTDLIVVLKDGGRQILIEDDIEEVIG